MSIMGFSDDAVKWFQSYQPNQKFSVNYDNFFKHHMRCATRVYPWFFTSLDLC